MNGRTLDWIARGLAKRGVSRRDLLRGSGAALAAIALPVANRRQSASAQATPAPDRSTTSLSLRTGEPGLVYAFTPIA